MARIKALAFALFTPLLAAAPMQAQESSWRFGVELDLLPYLNDDQPLGRSPHPGRR